MGAIPMTRSQLASSEIAVDTSQPHQVRNLRTCKIKNKIKF
jgi:hypothetical protein